LTGKVTRALSKWELVAIEMSTFKLDQRRVRGQRSAHMDLVTWIVIITKEQAN